MMVYEMMYLIVFMMTIVAVLIRFVYIRIKYPFWAFMPVHHTYDYQYWFSKEGREIHKLPYRNKFIDSTHVETINFNDITETQLKDFVELLQCFYIPDEAILYTIVEKDMKAMMHNHFAQPFVSFYGNKGCIASYPIRIFYHNVQDPVCANYITYIATNDRTHTQNISRNLISTHEFNCRRQNPSINVSVLKKEIGSCDGVTPFLEFDTCVFQLDLVQQSGFRNLVQISRKNWDMIFDTISKARFDLVVSIDVEAIKSRIDANQMFVYAFCEKGSVLALYFIENSHILYEETNHKTLRLLASVNDGLTNEMFQRGFIESLRKVAKKNLDYKMIMMDNVGHNSHIMENMKQVYEIRFETKGAYYYLNWLCVNKIDREHVILII